MAQNLTLWNGASYSDVPAVNLPKTGGGLAKFTDVTPTDAIESDVTSGKVFFKSDGSEAVGTASGGGGESKNFQIENANRRIASSTYIDTGLAITVEKSGTYNIYYSAFRSSTSGTSGTQLYKNNSSLTSENTTWQNSYCQSIKVSNITLNVNDTVQIYARSRNTSYYVCVANLIIEEV